MLILHPGRALCTRCRAEVALAQESWYDCTEWVMHAAQCRVWAGRELAEKAKERDRARLVSSFPDSPPDRGAVAYVSLLPFHADKGGTCPRKAGYLARVERNAVTGVR